MDVSEKYIELCKKAVEIQDYRKKHKKTAMRYTLELGDYYIDPISHTVCIYQVTTVISIRGTYIWLPRQEQLQDILKNDKNGWYLYGDNVILLKEVYEWAKENFAPPLFGAASMEQLWLGFAMYKKYNKVWKGKNWVKE